MTPPPPCAFLIAARDHRNLIDDELTLTEIGERQHRDLLRWCLLIIGGNRELGTTRIEFNHAVEPGFSTMRRYFFFG
jgi:hypothetical protein